MQSLVNSMKNALFDQLLNSVDLQFGEGSECFPRKDPLDSIAPAVVEGLKTICLAYRYSFPRACDCGENVPDSFSKGIDFGPSIGVRKCCKCIDGFRPYDGES